MMVRLERLLGVFLILVVTTGVILFIYLNNTQNNDPFKDELRLSDLTGRFGNMAQKEDGPPRTVRDGYCNFPQGISLGSEGLPPTEYKLVSVIALVRHGNRLPMASTPALGYLEFPVASCIVNETKSEISSKLLKRFLDKTAHTPESTQHKWPFPLRPMSERCAHADLTQIGVEQHIMVGQVLQKAYGEQLELSQDNIRVVSTVRTRTYHSAVALVFGLLQDKVDYDTLDIESCPTTQFCRSEKAYECICPRSAELLAAGEKTLRDHKKLDPYFDHFNSTVYEAMRGKYQIRSYYPWKTAHDMMISRICRKIPLPCNGMSKCLTELNADMSWQSLNFYHLAMSQNKDMILSAKFLMFPFIRELVKKLTNHSSQITIKDTISVYSGHDNTIVPFLLALELPVKQWPPFASRLLFELYKPLPGSHYSEPLFKLIYNGKDITRYLKFCLTNVSVRWTRTGCALADLVNFYQNLLPIYLKSCK